MQFENQGILQDETRISLRVTEGTEGDEDSQSGEMRRAPPLCWTSRSTLPVSSKAALHVLLQSLTIDGVMRYNIWHLLFFPFFSPSNIKSRTILYNCFTSWVTPLLKSQLTLMRENPTSVPFLKIKKRMRITIHSAALFFFLLACK